MTEQNQPQAEPKQQPQPTKPKPPSLTQILNRKSVEERAAGIQPAPAIIPPPKAASGPGRQYAAMTWEDDAELDLKGVNNQIDSYNNDRQADPQHPGNSRSRPLHKNYQEYINSRYELKAKLESESGEPDDLEAAKQKQAGRETREQTLRYNATMAEVEELRKLGFDPVSLKNVPKDITENTYQLVRAEVRYAKGKFLEGDQIIRDVARKLKISPSTMQAHFDLRDVSDISEKETISGNIVRVMGEYEIKHIKKIKGMESNVARIMAESKKEEEEKIARWTKAK